MEEKLEQLLEATRQTVIKAVLHDLKIWAERPLEDYTDVDGYHPTSLEDLSQDLITCEVEHLSAEFQTYLGIPLDEYDDDIFRTEADFRYSVFDTIYKMEEYKQIIAQSYE